MNIEEVKSIVAEYIRGNDMLRDFVENEEGGRGNCMFFSLEFLKWADKHLIGEPVQYLVQFELCERTGTVSIPDDYPKTEDDCYHYAARLPSDTLGKCIIVDLTARQFDEAAPFPLIWETEFDE